MDESVTVKEPLFKILAADDDDTGITEIESLCMACEKNVSQYVYVGLDTGCLG